MKKISFITKLAIVGLMCTVLPSHASADHKIGSFFQAVVLSQEQSPDLDVSVGRYFENGYKHVMQPRPRGGYRKTEKYHSTADIDLVIAMIGNESSVVSYKNAKNLKPTY